MHVVLPLCILLHEPLLSANIGLSQLPLVLLIILVLHLVPPVFVHFKIVGVWPLDTVFGVLTCHHFVV